MPSLWLGASDIDRRAARAQVRVAERDDASGPPPLDPGEPSVTILHVSDPQFGKHHRFTDPDGGFDTLLRRLCDDLDGLAHDHGLAPDLIALTGDLAEWGMKRELDQVATFAEGLRAHLALDADRLLVVPGNHDINRKLCEAYFARCDGDETPPVPPYWPKWEPYRDLFGRLYREVDRYRFTQLEPWTLFEIPALKVVVAGLNSTLHESHRDHHGFVGEAQLRWFEDKLAPYERQGWLRLGLVHHNALRRAADDDENLRDADDLRNVLGERLHLLLHGHTHQGQVDMLGPTLPVVSTGSAAVKRDQRPGPPEQPGETPNQYQLVRLTPRGLQCAARAYDYQRKRWIGDTRVSSRGDRWWYELEREWLDADTTFHARLDASTRIGGLDGIPEDRPSARHRLANDLLDDAIAWSQIRDEGRLASVTRVPHRGPWGDYAKLHDRDRGISLLGAYAGELTLDVLERWVSDVHDPFRGRGQAISTLVVATERSLDPELRATAQRLGVEVDRMIDYQRVLDIRGYTGKLRDQLVNDRLYRSEYYLKQRISAWSTPHSATERSDHAADWLTARLREREGAFVLILGAAGVGKTFLLREVVRRLHTQQAITPLLIEMRDLERARSIEELAATQFTRFGIPWQPRAFRRDLEDGRIALLFDGFDELALRVRSAAIPVHFERISAAAVGHARIVVSSRTEHFLSSGQVADLMKPSSAATTPLGGMLELVPRRQVVELQPFERDDVATYLRQRLGDHDGDARHARLNNVHDLVGLACNPRMLGFLVDIPDDKLAQAADLSGSITSDALYRFVIDDAWLAREAERLSPPGAAPGPDAPALRDAATNLALQLWRDPIGGLRTEQIGAHTGSLLARMCDDDTDWAAQTARARTLLTRDDRGRLRFVHQTVLEWLVVDRLADEMLGRGNTSHLEVGRLNTFMIDLLRQRLDDEALVHWAEAKLAGAQGSAAENARAVLQRLDREGRVRADHRDKDLRGQDLGGQSLRGAILDRAELTGARLIQRDLTGASLVGAQLAYADFTEACLRGADLSDANLSFARFHRADLADARLTGARLTGASFLGATALSVIASGHGVGIARSAPPSIETVHGGTTTISSKMAVSHDGSYLVTGHTDGTVCVWETDRRRLIRVLSHHGAVLCAIAISPDGRFIAAGDIDGHARIWNTESGSEHAQLTGTDGRVLSVAFSPDSLTLASSTENGTVQMWSTRDGSKRWRAASPDGYARAVAFTLDGTIVAACHKSGAICLRNANDGTIRASLPVAYVPLLSLAISPDGQRIVGGAYDGNIHVRDIVRGNTQLQMQGHVGHVLSVAFSRDGKTFATGGTDHAIRMWDMDGHERQRFAPQGEVWTLGFAGDGKTLICGCADNGVHYWELDTATEKSLPFSSGSPCFSVAFSPDGATLAGISARGLTRIWNLQRGVEIAALEGHRSPASRIAFSPRGRLITSVTRSDAVRLWSATDHRELPRVHWPKGGCSIAFSADERYLAVGANDGAVWLWCASEGQQVDPGTMKWQRLTGHHGRVTSVVFPANRNALVSVGEEGRARWHHFDGRAERVREMAEAGITCATLSPDGRLSAFVDRRGLVSLCGTLGDRGCHRFDLAAWSVCYMAFSPDGRMLATSGQNEIVQLWDIESRREIARLVGHRGNVSSVAFSPDRATLATGGEDGTLRLWDIASRQCLAILCSSAGGAIAIRQDGRYRVRGNVSDACWHVIGLHRYEIGELDALIPGLRLGDDEPLYTRPEATAGRPDAAGERPRRGGDPQGHPPPRRTSLAKSFPRLMKRRRPRRARRAYR